MKLLSWPFRFLKAIFNIFNWFADYYGGRVYYDKGDKKERIEEKSK